MSLLEMMRPKDKPMEEDSAGAVVETSAVENAERPLEAKTKIASGLGVTAVEAIQAASTPTMSSSELGGKQEAIERNKRWMAAILRGEAPDPNSAMDTIPPR